MDPFDNHDAATMHADALQGLLLRTDTLEDFLLELAMRAARDTRHRCAITVRADHGQPHTTASSDELSRQLDERQYAGGEGPCLDALETAVPVFVNDMAAEVRWGPYPGYATQLGALASMSYPLLSGAAAIGVLNLYAFEALLPGVDVPARAALIAEHAAGAIALALRIAERGETCNLRTALSSRSAIDQAIGILMAQQRCDAGAAFGLLRRASQGRNIKLREVAAGIVAGVECGAPGRSRGRV